MSFPTKKEAGYAGLFILMLLLLFQVDGFGQKRLRYEADKQIGKRENGVRTDYIVGNVIIKQGETTIYADSAIVQKESSVAEAFGDVRVTEGDSIDIRARRLLYGGGSGTARLREEVVYRDGETVLYTDSLDYNKFDGIARYFGGGRMVDGDNTLVSDFGVFDKQNNTARFYGGVELRTKDGVVNSDTLIYNTETKVATFKGPTTITDKDGNESFAENGLIRNTNSESTTIFNGTIENEDYIITGNQLNYDQLNDVSTATGNVVMTSKTDEVVITGERSVYNKKTGLTHIFGNPVMRRPIEGDTLYLSADTLVSIDSQKDADKRLLAFHDVKIYKEDLQGIADSLVYYFADSTIFFYQDPVLWNDRSQLSGDTISVLMVEKKIDQLKLHSNAFVITQDSLENFNQVKGRQLAAFFKDSELSRIDVNGNGESIYFVLEEEEDVLVGMNRITSGSMQMEFLEGELDHIKFYTNPEGKFVPPHELQEPDKRLTGFSWRAEERPTRPAVLRLEEKADSPESATEEAPAVEVLPKGELLPGKELPVQKKNKKKDRGE
ncbi:OstA-like protein [Nafulsella turpanensis]|uniref:OstA-like protein n=1 Tax=Nafulsella turpanensis TaxID=1265690 RepID=UPI00034D8D60|nr:OstA-like protein [Nafulsella turpanensis]